MSVSARFDMGASGLTAEAPTSFPGMIRSGSTQWRSYLERATHDFYHLPEYVEFAARHEQGEALAFHMETPEGSCLVPLVRRGIPENLGQPAAWCDLTSPYGYASPLCLPELSETVTARCVDDLMRWGRGHDVVTIFLRFHPLLDAAFDVWGRYGELVTHGQTVAIDLTRKSEEVWAEMRKNHRTGIRDLLREGFHATINDWTRLDDFKAAYRETMARVGAAPFYFFTDNYFEDLRKVLGDRLMLVCVFAADGDFAAGGLFTREDRLLQLHLLGTRDAYLANAPAKLIIDFMRRVGQDEGFKWLHLGGGVGAAADPLLHFKVGFSELRGTYRTMRIVIDEKRYVLLRDAHRQAAEFEAAEAADYFPIYRYDSRISR